MEPSVPGWRERHASYWLTGSFTEQVSCLHTIIRFVLLQPNIFISQPPSLHSEGWLCAHLQESKQLGIMYHEQLPLWLHVSSQFPKLDAQPQKHSSEGQKTSLKGVWERKQKQRKTQLCKVSIYQVLIICLHLAHTPFKTCQGAWLPASENADPDNLSKVQSEIAAKRKEHFIFYFCVCMYMGFPRPP